MKIQPRQKDILHSSLNVVPLAPPRRVEYTLPVTMSVSYPWQTLLIHPSLCRACVHLGSRRDQWLLSPVSATQGSGLLESRHHRFLGPVVISSPYTVWHMVSAQAILDCSYYMTPWTQWVPAAALRSLMRGLCVLTVQPQLCSELGKTGLQGGGEEWA